MIATVNGVQLGVFVALFGFVSVLGFLAATGGERNPSPASTNGVSAGAGSAPGSAGS
jgi:hypothetical protein